MVTDEKRLPARFLALEGGREPVRDRLLGLSAEDRKAIGDDIRTAELGWPIGMPLCRSLKGRKGLWGGQDETQGWAYRPCVLLHP